jgi:hypothetical protein
MIRDVLIGFVSMFFGEDVNYISKGIVRFYTVFTGVIVIVITLMLL